MRTAFLGTSAFAAAVLGRLAASDHRPGLVVTRPDSGITRLEDLKGKSFAFGDKGSTSGYLIPTHQLLKMGIADPEKYFGRVVYTRHQAIETQVTRGELDAGADYAATVAGRLTAQIEETFTLDAVRVQIGASIGIAVLPDDAVVMVCSR